MKGSLNTFGSFIYVGILSCIFFCVSITFFSMVISVILTIMQGYILISLWIKRIYIHEKVIIVKYPFRITKRSVIIEMSDIKCVEYTCGGIKKIKLLEIKLLKTDLFHKYCRVKNIMDFTDEQHIYDFVKTLDKYNVSIVLKGEPESIFRFNSLKN